MRKVSGWTSLCLVLVLLPLLVFAAGPGSGSGSGSGEGGPDSGCGDVLGDLIHIKRDAVTGQPILQKRWIEYPQDVLAWGYCPIPVTATGEEIGFVDLSCDPLDTTAVVEVDYFGRLSGGRTKERNSRMHFNEVIASIKDAERVRQDKTGRLELGYECEPNANDVLRCATWSTIDSPMENLALYTRLMKYGHLQTDPMEVDTFAHGDPAAGIQYHPALGPEDWGKFGGGLKHLLPGGAGGDPVDCFSVGFNQQCAQPESLNNRDFVRAASFLAGAASKGGIITVDLVQYMNRILKIAQVTEATASNPDTLPALIRDCGDDPNNQLPSDQCSIIDATVGMPAPSDERFVDFAKTRYVRNDWRDMSLKVLAPLGSGFWLETSGVELLGWLEYANGAVDGSAVRNVQGFVDAASDGLRAIEFVHNYAIPEDLGWDFE